MKNTKSLVSTGVILTIALFTSVQGQKDKTINPHLTQENVAKIQEYINTINFQMLNYLHTIKNKDMRDSLQRNGNMLLQNCEKALYGNAPVTQRALDLLERQKEEWMRRLILAYQYDETPKP